MSSGVTNAEISTLSYKEFDKKLRRVSEKRHRRPTKVYYNHLIVRKVKAITPSLKPYAKEDLALALRDIFLELRNRMMTKGFILNIPYSMGIIRIRDVSENIHRYQEKQHIIDWPATTRRWYEDKRIGNKYTVSRNMALSVYKASYVPHANCPRNLKNYYTFTFMRSFRQAIYQSYLNSTLICYE